MTNFSFPEVETRFLTKYPEGSISFNKKCLVTFSSSSKCYEYSYKNPIDLMRKLELASDDEFLILRGKKRCNCGSREIVKIEESECFRCKVEDDEDLFS
jgi:hypothetical protein